MSRVERYFRIRGNRAVAIYASTLLALLMLVLSACGSNTGGQGQEATPTPTHASQVQKCGTVHTLHSTIAPGDQEMVKQAENCFWQAFQQCQPATLTYQQNELDTGTIHTFTLKSSAGKCNVSDGVQHYIAPQPPGGTTTYACSDVKLQTDGLYIFSCGDVGTVIVPSK
jgi:hypothetical protein